ncbi:MAG: selenocysteine lyase [Xanthomonadaceae bacterium]|nr:selenocysteine lyase [Xanthomonadaceae bacterium]
MRTDHVLEPSATAQPAQFCLPDGIVYLDTAAHGPRLRSVQHAASAALDAASKPWQPSEADWEAAIERVRALAADCFDGDASAIALVPSAAYGMAVAANNVPLARGDGVLVLAGTFPSQWLAWQRRCAQVGARIVAVQAMPGESATDAVVRTLATDPSVRVLLLAHVDWRDGSVLDLDAIAARAHAAGAALVLDLSQSLGAYPAHVARWRPAFAVTVGYKWLLGPAGLAYVWAAAPWREHGEPIEHHWLARDPEQVWLGDVRRVPAFRAGARRFDAGGVADPMRLAMAEAALAQIGAWRIEAIAPALHSRTAALADGLRALGLSSWLAPAATAHILGVRPPRERLQAVAGALARAGIVATVRQGYVRLAPHLHVGAGAMASVAAVMAAAARDA